MGYIKHSKKNEKHHNKNQKKHHHHRSLNNQIEQLNSKIELSVPPHQILYYKLISPQQEKQLNIPLGAEQEDIKPPDQQSNTRHLFTRNQKKIKIRFGDLSITSFLSRGLSEAKFYRMTEIQRSCIPHALSGRNIVGCSKTGSGKTLAYLIPLIQNLYREKWAAIDGLGALVLVPTRELAIQVFETLRKIGKYHKMSAGMITGGKSVQFEKECLYRMNILIATPGRLLQHLEETRFFEADNLKFLVFDEVDQILDMGFSETIRHIMSYLPINRKKMQYMFFSATITHQIRKLIHHLTDKNDALTQIINLSHAANIIVENNQRMDKYAQPKRGILNEEDTKQQLGSNEEAEEDIEIPQHLIKKGVTPIKLTQNYMILPINQKLDMLFSFIKSHQKEKCIVFFSSCKQVRFAFQTFMKLKPGVKLYQLHGRQKQAKRTAIFFEFMQSKKKGIYLFATDIASRGIDFPSVDWVIQYDCPESVVNYVHRAGRTARYKSKGNSLLFLLKSEKKFIERLEEAKIPLKKVKANSKSELTIQESLGKILVTNRELMELAQKAFKCYVRSVFLMPDKEVFKFNELNFEDLARSLGLVSVPQIKVGGDSLFNKILQGGKKRDDDDDDDDDIEQKKKEKKSKLQKLRDKIQKKRELSKKQAERESEKKSLQEDINHGDFEAFVVNQQQQTPQQSQNFYQKVKKDLDKSKESDSLKQKMRVKLKHSKKKQKPTMF